MMITLTDNAINRIGQFIEQEDEEIKSQALRLVVAPGGCSGFSYGLFFDDIKEDDIITNYNDFTFVVDPESLQYLEGTVIDYKEGLTGAGFDFQNPNASRSCGCGKSFS